MCVIPLVTFLVARGRDYYLAPAYLMFLATGPVWDEKWGPFPQLSLCLPGGDQQAGKP
jgi:hypothetical protein